MTHEWGAFVLYLIFLLWGVFGIPSKRPVVSQLSDGLARGQRTSYPGCATPPHTSVDFVVLGGAC